LKGEGEVHFRVMEKNGDTYHFGGIECQGFGVWLENLRFGGIHQKVGPLKRRTRIAECGIEIV